MSEQNAGIGWWTADPAGATGVDSIIIQTFKLLITIMAKGNMLLGQSRGKLGDVVFTRMNGEQIARPRVRHPRNPRTNKQLYQRAVMATIMQAYSAGIEIFDHSFQGKARGYANQRYFMKINTKKLRTQIARDLESGAQLASQNGRVVGPGVTVPVPGILQVSEGELDNVLFDAANIPGYASATETVAQYCSRLGLVAGDLFTFVGLVVPANAFVNFSLFDVNSDYAKHFACQFVFARYAVKESALTSTDVVANLGQILELNDQNFTPILQISALTIAAEGAATPKITTLVNATSKGTYAWIRSRINEDLRSTETMAFDGTEFGIASEYVLKAWKQGTQDLGDSDLILEGGDV